jgi:hypothetical protein
MKMKEREFFFFIGYRMNSNFLFVKNYCNNIANEEPDEESVGACFLVLALYLWKYRAVLELL